jgi:hypothetical protein
MPALPQAVPSATVDADVVSDGTQMRMPPPVSGEAYPTGTGAETRSNQLSAGLTFNSAYDDNVLGGSNISPKSDVTYSVGSTFSLDQSTPRVHEILTYSPGFTLYQRTHPLNAADQDVSLHFLYRLSPHAAVSLADSFQKMSNVFNQPYEGVPSSAQTSIVAAVAPFADHLGNAASAQLSYQFRKNSMIGGSGTSTLVNYRSSAEASGLSNSNSRGGSAFYNLRLSNAQYMGAAYQYSIMVADSTNDESDIHLHTFSYFYTIYLDHNLSLSVSGGPQHFELARSSLKATGSWKPTATASMGWQRRNANLAASYSRSVTGDGGLLGAFQSNSADASLRWQLSRFWTVGSTASYGAQKNILAAFYPANPGGHSISGSVSVQHIISEHLSMALGYERLHQSYSGVAVISNAPDSNRESISILYQFTRLIGR